MSRRTPAHLLGAVLALAALGGCVYPATEVFVVLDTDFPADRPLEVTAITRRGSTGDGTRRVWIRGDSTSFDGGAPIVFPASFAIIPGEGAPRDGTIDLEIAARLAPAHGEPEATTRRRARFRFTPRQPTVVRVFLSRLCSAQASGCTSATGSACTVSQYCEDRGETCGDDGRCTAPEVTPTPTNGDVVLQPDDASRDTSDLVDASDVGNVVDALDAVDATDATDAIDPATIDPPRLVAPLSGSNVANDLQPLAFELAPGTDGAFVEVCAERACPAFTIRIDAHGSPVPLATRLTPGVWYWRAFGSVGGVQGTRASPTWQFHLGHRNATAPSWWGTRLDLNGDGFDDVAIGHPAFDSDRGTITGHPGSATGVPASAGFTLSGEATGISFGIILAPAGDVDGDGFVDLAVTALGSNDRVRVYRGSPTGPIAPPAWILRPPEALAGGFGGALAAAGDVDGDGFADLAVGAPTGDSDAGRLYLYRGGPTGLGTMPSVTIASPAGGQFGRVIAAADVNGDHYSDVLAGAAAVGMGAGRVYVFHGGPGGIATTPTIELNGRDVPGAVFGAVIDAAGDLNGDGFADVLVGAYGEPGGQAYTYLGSASGIQPAMGTTILGVTGTNRFGIGVTGDGDIDGDGYADLVISDSSIDRVFVYRGGGPTNGVTSPAWADFRGPADGAGGFGNYLAGGGDVDRDGFDDFVVVTNGGSNTQAYLVRGGATPPTAPAVRFELVSTPDTIISVAM